MATSDHNVNQNNFNATLASNPGTGTARSYGKHTIPRPNIQQNTTHSTRKQDPNHLIFRREGEKEEDTDTTGTGDEKEVMKHFLHIASCYSKVASVCYFIHMISFVELAKATSKVSFPGTPLPRAI